MRFRALLLLAIAAGVHAGPLSFEETQCATTCVPSTKFGYETGNTYRFEYEADTVTSLVGAADEHSGLFVRTTADIHVLSPCELVLTLRDTRLEEADPRDLSSRETSRNNAGFSRQLEENALRFSFQDGAIPEVCASEGDDTWVVNVKRGVLSAFQNSMPNIDDDHTVSESDVSGNCDALYKVDTLGFNTVTLKKSKNLLGCTDRTGHFTSLQANNYNVPSEIQSLPLLRSTHDCEQVITSGILVSSECHESHVFRPFSKQSSGAQTTIRQSLVYQGVVRASPGSTGQSRRTTLLFEHEPRMVANSNDLSKVTSVLEAICEADDIRPNTPELFARLTYAMRQMDESSLSRLHRMVKRDRICSSGNSAIAAQFFFDAIPATNTEASVSLIRDLIQSGEMSENEVDMWISSLAFIPEPTLGMVEQAKSLLQRGGRTAYLSISSLVHTYCKTDAQCMDKAPVSDVINAIVENIGYNCRAGSDEEMENMIVALKALGNSGATSRVASTLARCVSQSDNRIEVRLAAIEAYRRLPCEQSREELLRLMSDSSEEVEVRVAAYLAVMQCPTSGVIATVKNVLENEEINQVGSFMWTHLTNLQETADPFKQDIRSILEDDVLAKEFNLDARKFSRNYEGSLFFDSVNAGARYESNLIWSPSSFLPRSAMLNLTVDMFGKSVNLLEIGGRAEGLEQYLEMMFGPNGYFPNSKVNDAINARLASIDEGLKNRIQRDPKASGYMKIFGNELKYWDTDFQQHGEPFNILNFLIMLAQDHQAEVTRSMMFLDSEMTTPTAAGFPLKLAVNGSAAINVKVGGKMDLRRAAVLPSTLLIDGYLKPSAAVTVTSIMGVDMSAARTGLKMVSTMHTSTQMTGTIDLQETTILNAHFDMPEETQEILNVESKFFMIHGNEEREQAPLATSDRIETTSCSSDRFVTISGMRICQSYSLPAEIPDEETPDFPFNGPMRSSVTLEKADTHTGYDIEARFETRKERKNNARAYTNVARLAFNTPGSQIDRQFAADVTLDQYDMKLNANLLSPWKQATLDASVATDPSLLGANLEITVDQAEALVFRAQLATEAQGEGFQFSPLVVLQTPWLRPITLRGQTKVLPGPNVDVDLTFEAFTSPVTLTGSIELAGQRYHTDLTLASPLVNGKVTGFTAIKEGTFSTRMEVEYDYQGRGTNSFVVNSKLKDTSTNRALKYSVNTAITMSEYPDYNFEIDSDFLFNARHMETSLAFTYGPDLRDTDKRIAVTHSADFKGDWENYEFEQTWGLKWNEMGVNMNGKFTHAHVMGRELDTTAMLTYAPGKEVNTGLSIKKLSIEPLRVSGDLTLSYPGREMRLYKIVEEKETGIYETNTIVQWQSGRQITLDSIYRNEHPMHSLHSEVNLPSGSQSTIDTSITLDLMNFAARGAVNHNNRVYSSAVDYSLNLNRMQLESNFDLVMPRRHVTMESSATWRQGEYSASVSTFWDADNDRSKKVIFATSLGLNGNQHDGQFKVVYPGRKVTMQFNQAMTDSDFTHSSKLSWIPKKAIEVEISSKFPQGKLENDVEIKTPFFNDVKLNTNLEQSNTGVQGSLNLDYGSVISGEFEVSKANEVTSGSATVHTPFRGWERLVIETSATCQEAVKELNVELSKNEQKIEMQLSGSKQLSAAGMQLQGRALIKTPFTDDLVINAEHAFDGTNIESSASLAFANKEITSALTVIIDNILSHSGTFQLRTPYTMFADVETTWESRFDAGITDFSLTHMVRVNRDRVTYTIANRYIQGDNMETSLNVETSFRALRNLAITTTGSKPSEGHVRLISTLVLNDMQHARLQTDLTDSGPDCEARVNLQTSLTQDLTFVASRTQSVTPHLDHVEFSWAPNKVVALDFERRMESYDDFSGEWRLTTPFRNFERIVLNCEHSINNYGWNQATFLEYAPNKRVSVASSFDTSRKISAALEIEAPCEYFRSLKAALSHEGTATDFEHTSSLAFNMDAYPEMKYESAFTMRGADYLVGSADIVTPCPFLRNHRITIDHQLQGDEYVTRAVAAFHPSHETTVEASYKNTENDFKLSGELQSSCELLQSLSFGVEHTGSGIMFTGSGHVESRVAEFPVAYSHSYSMRGLRSANFEAQLQNPLMEQVSFSLSHDYNGNSLNCNSELQFGRNKRITMTNTMAMDNGLNMETHVTTPFNLVRSLDLQINHVGTTGEQFTCQSEASVNTAFGEYKINSDVSVNGFEEVRGELNVNDMYKLNLEHNFREYRQQSFDMESSLKFGWARKEIQLAYTADARVNDDLMTSTETYTFTSPFRGYEQIQFIANGTLKTEDPIKFDASRKVIYSRGKEITVNYGMDLEEQNGYFNFATPYAAISKAEVAIGHLGDLRNFRNYATLTFTSNRQTTSVSGESAFHLSHNAMALAADVNTNLAGFEKFSVSSNGDLMGQHSAEGSFRLEYPSQVITMSGEVRAEQLSDISASIEFAGPVELSMNLGHNGDLEHFENHLEVVFNGQRSRFDGAFDLNPISGRFSLNTPYQPIRSQQLEFSASGDWFDFSANGELTFGANKKISTSGSMSVNRGFESTFTLTTPYTQTIDVSISHVGDIVFTHESRVSYGRRQLASLTGRFNLHPCQGDITLTTPLGEMGIALGSQGDRNEFTSSTTLSFNRNYVTLGADFSSVDGITAKTSLTSSFRQIDGLSAEASFKYLPELAAKLHLQGFNKVFDFESGLSLSTMEAFLKLQCPCQYLRNIDIQARHTGDFEQFTGSYEASINDARLTASAEYNGLRMVRATLDMDIPEVPKIEGSMLFKLRRNLDAELELSYGNNKQIRAAANFELQPLNGGVTFTSPCPYLRDVALTLKNQENNGRYETEMTFEHDLYGRTNIRHTLNLSRDIEATLNIESPCPLFSNVEVNFNHVGDLSNFRNSISYENGRNVYSYEGSFNPSRAEFKLESPHSPSVNVEYEHSLESNSQFANSLKVTIGGIEGSVRSAFNLKPLNVEITTTVNGDSFATLTLRDQGPGKWTNFDTTLEATFAGETILTGSAQFDATSGVSGRAAVDTRWSAPAELSFTHSGSLEEFECQGSFAYAGQQWFDGTLRFDLDPVTLQTTMSSAIPQLRNLDFGFMVNGDMREFQAESSLAHNSANLFQSDFSLGVTENSAQLTIRQVKIGRIVLEDISLNANYERDESSFRTHVEGTMRGKTVSADVEFEQRPLSLSVTANTPFRGYETVSASYNHRGNFNSAFGAKAEVTYKAGKTISVEFNTKNYKKMAINLEVKTPFGEGEFSGKYMNADSTMTSKVELKVGRINIDGSIDLDFTSSPSARIQLNTPFRGWEELSITADHNMDRNGAINTRAKFIRNGRAFGAVFSGNVVEITDWEGELTVNTPFSGFERYQLTVKHQGDLRQMQCDVSLMFPPENTVSGSFILSTAQGISTELKTNIRGFEDLAAEITLNGDLSAWSSSAMVRLAPRQRYNAALEFAMDNGINARATFNSPIRGYESLSVSLGLEGSMERFSGNSEFNWGERTLVSATMNGEFPYSATLNVNGKTMGWNLTPQNGGRVTGSAFLNWSRQIQIEANLQGSLTGDISAMQMDGSVEITTPFAMMQNVRLTVEHRHDVTSYLDCSAILAFNGANKLDYTVSASTRNARVTVNQPIRVVAAATFSGDSIEIQVERPIAVQATVRINANEISFAMTTPYSVSLSVTNEGNAYGFQMSEPYPVNIQVTVSGRAGSLRIQEPFEFATEFDFDNVNGQVDMKYPYDFSANYQLGYNGGQMRMRGLYDLEAAYNLDVNGGSINVRGPYQVDATYSMDSTHGSIDIARPIAIKAEYAFGVNGGHFVMEKPMQVDVRASLTEETASLVMTKPMPFDATATYSATAASFEMTNPMPINARASLTGSQALVVMTTPYRFDAVATYSTDEVSFVMQNPMRINIQALKTDEKISFVSQGLWNAEAYAAWNGFAVVMQNPIAVDIRAARGHGSASFEMTAPYQYTAQAAFVDNGASLTVSGPYPVDAAFTYDDTSASFTMSRPVPVDISAVYEGLSGSLTMNAPYRLATSYNFNSAAGVFSFNGPYQVEARYELNANGGSFVMTAPYSVDARFTMDSASGEIDIEQPIVIRARYSFDLATGGVFTMTHPVPIEARLELSEREGQLKVTGGPLPIDAAYTWNGERGTFTARKPLPVSAEFTFTPSEGSFRMQRPYNVDARYTFGQNGGSIIMDAPMRVNARYTLDRNGGSIVATAPIKVQATFSFSENGASFDMQKPIAMDAAYTFDGRRATFIMAKPYPISGEATFDLRSATLNVQQPIAITAEAYYDGPRYAFAMTEPYAVAFAGEYRRNSFSLAVTEPIQVTLEGVYDDNSATLTMHEPISATAEGFFDGTRASFSLDRPYPIAVGGSFDGETVTFEMRQPYAVSTSGSFDGRNVAFSIDRPYPVAFDGSFDGETVTFNMRQPYAMSASGRFDGRTVEFSMDRPQPVAFEASFDGETATFNMRQPYAIDVSGHFRQAAFEATSASFTMRQPFPMSASGSFDGRNLAFDLDRPLPVSFQVSFDGYRASFAMSQPYRMSVSGHFDGRTASFDMDRPCAVSFEGGLVDRTVSFTMRQPYAMSMSAGYDGTSGSFNLDRPYPISVEGGVSGQRAFFDMRQPIPLNMNGQYGRDSASITISGMARLDAEGSFDGTRARFAMREPYSMNVDGHFDGRSASFNLDRPYPVSVDGSFDGSRAGFNMRQPYPVSAEGSFDGRQGALRLDGPYRLDVAGEFDGSRGSIQMQQPYAINMDAAFDGFQATFNLDRPYPVSVRAGLGFNDAMFVMDAPMEIDVQATYSLTDGSIIMTKPYPIDARYTLNQDAASFTMRQPYPIDVSATYSVNGASLNMAQPMVIDARVELAANSYGFIMQRPTPVELRFETSHQAGVLTVVRPMPMEFKYDYEGSSLNDFTANVGINWNTARRGSAIDLSMKHKDASTATSFHKEVDITLALPTRTVQFALIGGLDATSVMTSAVFAWDKTQNKIATYWLLCEDLSTRYKTDYSFHTTITTPLRTLQGRMVHRDEGQSVLSSAHVQWDMSRDESKDVFFVNTYTRTASGLTHEFRIESPLLSKDIVLTNDVTMQQGHVYFASNHKLAYHVDTRHDFVMSTKLSDEGNTRYGNHNYTALMTMSHVRSTIDVTLGAHVANTDRAYSAGSYVNYMMTHGDVETLMALAQVNRIARTLDMQLLTPFYTASVTGVARDNEANIVAQDGEREIRAVAEMTESGFELKAYPFPREQTVVSIRGEYRSANEIALTVSHGNDEYNMVTDSELSLDLQDDHLVHSRAYVRPELMRDVKNSLRSLSLDSAPFTNTLSAVRSDIARELRSKVYFIAENSIDMSSALRAVSGEAESWVNDAKATKREFNRMYMADEFFMKTVDRAVTSVASKAAAFTVRAFNDMTAALRPALHFLSQAIDTVSAYVITPIVEECLDFWAAYGPIIVESIEEMSVAVARELREIGEEVAEKMALVAEKLGHVAVATAERVAVVMEPCVRAYVSLYNRFYAWVERKQADFYVLVEEIMEDMDFTLLNAVVETAQSAMHKIIGATRFLANQTPRIPLLRPVYDARLSLADNIADVISMLTSWSYDVTRMYVVMLENVHDVIANVYGRVMEMEQTVFMREAVCELAEQLHWSYRYLDIEGKMAMVLDSILDLSIEVIRVNLEYLTSDWLKLDLDRIITWSPRDGLLELQFWIPSEWPSFQTVPFAGIDWSDIYKRAMIVLDNLLPDNLNPWDVYYQYKPSSNMGDWIPPFEAIATISGQYITTFDGRAFEFLGGCSYVLSRDVIDSTFTLFKNYDKDHLTLVSDNKQVEVSLDGRVRVDMEPIEAPYEYENTQITRVGDMLKVTHARGFSLECDLLNQMCIFRMSGWYHGKVAGLMGTYTNEPTDDWLMSNGEMAGNVEQLARSWEATGSCTAHDNMAQEYAMVESRASGRVCGALFMSRLSPMRNCFKVVDPRPYLRACINDVEETSDDRRGVCKVSAAYVARCNAKHVDVRPPKVCMRNEDFTSTPSADIVFVVEQKSCNDEIVSKLDNLAKMIDRSLIDRGMSANRFGVVGFGSVGVHDAEHIQTVSGSVFGTSRDVATIENSMLFSEGGENSDSLRALNMAIDYPFRVGAAKSIVMITCSACQEQTIQGDDVSARLESAGIQLHVLVEHEFETGSGSGAPKTTFLFGIDKTSAFTKSDVTDPELSGDLDLYGQVIPPSDACAKMALDTDGSFFNLERLTGGRVRTQKSFMDVFARRVAKTAESSPLMGRPYEEPEIYYDDKTFTLNFDDYMRS